MNVLDFNFIVLPLAGIVFILVAGIILILKRQEIRERRRLSAYLRGKAKQRELTESQLSNLNHLFENKSLDKETYERLKVIVQMNGEKSEETVEILSED